MTYCAGWKYKGCVYLIADTAKTISDKPNLDYSSFGQLHYETKNGYVQESLIKLVPISEGIAIGFAGDVQVALEILALLEDNAKYAKSTEDVVCLLNGMGPFNPKQEVSFIIASSSDNGNNELIKWNTAEGIDQTNADFYHIGRLDSYHANRIYSLFEFLTSKNLAADRVLPAIISVFQSYGVHEDLIQMNVGGLITGLRTTHGNITWLEDTNYVIYGSNIDSNLSYISAIVRDNAVIVRSSITNDTRVFYHPANAQPNINNQDWRDRVQDQLNSDRFRHWVFINKDSQNRVITLIIRNDLETESKYIRLSRSSEGKNSVAMSSKLEGILHRHLHNRNDDSIPFLLNVLND